MRFDAVERTIVPTVYHRFDGPVVDDGPWQPSTRIRSYDHGQIQTSPNYESSLGHA